MPTITPVERAAAAAFALLVVCAAWSAQRAPPMLADGATPVPTETKYYAFRGSSEPAVDADYRVLDGTGRLLVGLRVLDGEVYVAPGSLSTGVTVTGHKSAFFVDQGGAGSLPDLGTLVGAGSSDFGDGHLHVGIRYSPIRLVYGLIAPDVTLTTDAVGAGVSVYPPVSAVGPEWHKLGIGVWYGVPFKGGGAAGWFGGLSYSIRK